jgi:hypothetical protein
MGGNALKTVETRRYLKPEFDLVYSEIYHKLQGIAGDCTYVELVESYEDKDSFGDMDIVIVLREDVRILEMVKRVFNPREIFRNSNIVSFDYGDLQVDLIVQPNIEVAKFASNYFAFNDLGNFIGRTSQRLGFKFCHDGLKYHFRDPENISRTIDEILVTLDFREALEFLDFDYFRYLKGFKTKQDVFEFAASSSYFSIQSFLLENRNSEDRRRDTKRVMYQEALVYLKENFDVETSKGPSAKDRAERLSTAMNLFPDFKLSYDHALRHFEMMKAYKANFNGDNVSEWFGVEGVELGRLMQRYRVYFEDSFLVEWISKLDKETFRSVMVTLKDKVLVHEQSF